MRSQRTLRWAREQPAIAEKTVAAIPVPASRGARPRVQLCRRQGAASAALVAVAAPVCAISCHSSTSPPDISFLLCSSFHCLSMYKQWCATVLATHNCAVYRGKSACTP